MTDPADQTPTPDEERQAAALDAALRRLAPASAELAGLVRAAERVRRFADRVRADADPPPDETGAWADAGLPDPFPGEYRVTRLLGRGGFGEVWLAADLNLGVPVALKAVRHPDPTHLDALRREARALAGLRHPNVVRVNAWREAGGAAHYLVMQYVAGGSLADRVAAGGSLPWAVAARYAADVGDALAAVHAAGLVHRDVKPANVLWDADADEARLTDFGLAARLGGAAEPAGTPHYMPPEAFAGTAGPPADVYGLAATLFALATAAPPFPAERWQDVPAKAAAGLPDPDPRLTGVPERIDRLVRAGLAADPAARPLLPEFVAALRGALNQSLADALPAGGGPAVRLLVSRWDGAGYRPVTATGPPRAVLTRDLKRVPAEPPRVGLRTGDRVRVQAVADRPGYLTVFNVGPTGNLNPLYPDDPTRPVAIAAGQAVDTLDTELTPPAGPERVFAVWTRDPLPWSAADLRGMAARDVPPHYRATRDLQLLSQSVARLPAGDWHAVVLDLDHRAT